jgi:hypothetical protein
VARLGSFDLTTVPVEWFDINALKDASGWIDRDYVPFPTAPPPPPPFVGIPSNPFGMGGWDEVYETREDYFLTLDADNPYRKAYDAWLRARRSTTQQIATVTIQRDGLKVAVTRKLK